MECLDQLDALTLLGRRIRAHGTVEVRGTSRMGWLRWAHDHPLLVDPDPARHVDDAEQGIDDMRRIDERGMLGRRFRDPRTRGLAAARIERDGDDLETLRS